MSTGILSTATRTAGLPALSWLLLALAVAGGLALGVGVLVRWRTDRPGWLSDAATPASLTGVAATAVVGGGHGEAAGAGAADTVRSASGPAARCRAGQRLTRPGLPWRI